MFRTMPIVGPYAPPVVSPSGRPRQAQKKQVEYKPPETDLPRFINYMADMGGCGHYRILWPEQVINARGMAVSHNNTGVVTDPGWYTNAKVVQIQRQAADDHLKFANFLKQIQPQCGFKMVYNIDDVPFKEHIPDYNRFKFAFDNDNIRENIVNIIDLCDEVIVTCDYMKEVFHDVTGKKEITVIPNFPPHFWIGHHFDKKNRYSNYQRHKRKPRILYTGSGAHFDVDNKAGGKDDFEMMIKFIIDTRQKYQWVFVGAVPPVLVPYVKAGQIEVHQWVQLLDYPAKIASLDPTITIAPLQDNSFNKSKSDIKYVESAILGIPCLLQDIETYHTAPADIKFKNIDEFQFKLDRLLKKQQLYFKEVDKLRAYGQTRFLEHPDNIGCYMEAYMTPFGSEDRKLLSRYNK